MEPVNHEKQPSMHSDSEPQNEMPNSESVVQDNGPDGPLDASLNVVKKRGSQAVPSTSGTRDASLPNHI